MEKTNELRIGDRGRVLSKERAVYTLKVFNLLNDFFFKWAFRLYFRRVWRALR
jgi:hypothetical protein